MGEHTVRRDWINPSGTWLAVDCIVGFTAGESGGTVVFLKGGHTVTVSESTGELVTLIKEAGHGW
jgi:hypothetical protein